MNTKILYLTTFLLRSRVSTRFHGFMCPAHGSVKFVRFNHCLNNESQGFHKSESLEWKGFIEHHIEQHMLNRCFPVTLTE